MTSDCMIPGSWEYELDRIDEAIEKAKQKVHLRTLKLEKAVNRLEQLKHSRVMIKAWMEEQR